MADLNTGILNPNIILGSTNPMDNMSKIAQFQGLQLQNQQAPVSALAALSSIMGVLPQSSNQSNSQSSNSGSATGGIIPTLFGGK